MRGAGSREGQGDRHRRQPGHEEPVPLRAIAGTVPIPKAAMTRLASPGPPAAVATARAAYTMPHGIRPHSTPRSTACPPLRTGRSRAATGATRFHTSPPMRSRPMSPRPSPASSRPNARATSPASTRRASCACSTLDRKPSATEPATAPSAAYDATRPTLYASTYATCTGARFRRSAAIPAESMLTIPPHIATQCRLPSRPSAQEAASSESTHPPFAPRNRPVATCSGSASSPTGCT